MHCFLNSIKILNVHNTISYQLKNENKVQDIFLACLLLNNGHNYSNSCLYMVLIYLNLFNKNFQKFPQTYVEHEIYPQNWTPTLQLSHFEPYCHIFFSFKSKFNSNRSSDLSVFINLVRFFIKCIKFTYARLEM